MENSGIILARLRKTIRQSGTVDFVGQISSVCTQDMLVKVLNRELKVVSGVHCKALSLRCKFGSHQKIVSKESSGNDSKERSSMCYLLSLLH